MDVLHARVGRDVPEADSEWTRTALDALDLGVFEFDAVRGAQRFSDVCNRLWGLAPHEHATPERIAAMIHPDDRHALAVAYASLHPEGAGRFAVEHRIVRADGAVRWLLVRGRTTFSGHGAERRAVRSVGTMQDVTEFRTGTADRRAREGQHALMMALEDRLRPLSSPKPVKFEACRMLARALPVERVGYGEDTGDGETVTVVNDYSDGVPTLRGTFRYESFGSDVAARFRAGEIVMRADVAADPLLTDADRAAYAAIDVRATINVPLVKNGRLVALLFVHTARPRAWSADEIALVDAVAHRTWDAVERARAERRVRQAQRELRARTERLQLFIAHAPAAIAMLDRELRHLAVSRRYAEDGGTTAEALVGRPLDALFPDSRERWRTARAACLAGGTERCEGEPFTRANGAVRWLKWELRPWLTARGAVGGLLLFVEDITDRRQYETRLREAAARLRLAFEAAGLSPWRADLNADRFEASDAAVALHGLPPAAEAWTIERATQVIHPDDRARVLQVLSRAAREGVSVQVEYRTVWPDRTTRWIANAARGELDSRGRATGRVHGTVRDVTTEREVAMRIAASENRLRMTLEAAHAGAWDWDLTQGDLRWSDEAFDLFGLARGSVVRFDEVMLHVDRDDVGALRARIDAAISGAEPAFRAEYRITHPERGRRWVLSVGQVQRDADGTPVRMMSLALDVTAQKDLERDLRRAHEQKDRFLATLSHELRNPLAPIRTAAQILAAPHLDEERLTWARQVIQRQVTHMSLLLDDLLDVARITQGKLELKRERVLLHAVVDASVEAARPVLDRKHHELIVVLPEGAPPLDADPLRLAQVLSNLLTNAAKYTDPGGHVVLRAAVHEARLIVEVQDDGIGLEPASIEHLFEMFSQAPRGAGRAEGGLGIGLALVKGLVTLHGGTIDAASDGIGCGSTFRVTLPLAADATSGAFEASDESPSLRTGARRVLVVDDNRDGADSLALLLTLAGHDVRAAYGGQAALALAAAFDPEVAFIDLGMPDLDGCAVARELRERPGGTRVRLIALTGWGQDEDKRRTDAAGFDVHLTKPIDPERIESLLVPPLPPLG